MFSLAFSPCIFSAPRSCFCLPNLVGMAGLFHASSPGPSTFSSPLLVWERSCNMSQLPPLIRVAVCLQLPQHSLAGHPPISHFWVTFFPEIWNLLISLCNLIAVKVTRNHADLQLLRSQPLLLVYYLSDANVQSGWLYAFLLIAVILSL